uniref:Uncharacterized protein n=1 Tax=Anguilla anguilla TaxID=7936 RepID=A0A0E9QSC9_ANGAN
MRGSHFNVCSAR